MSDNGGPTADPGSSVALPRPRRWYSLATLVAFVALVMVGLCRDDGDSSLRLHVDLVSDGFELAWEAPPSHRVDAYDLEVRELQHHRGVWVPTNDWEPVPVEAGQTDASYRAVLPQRRYEFRIREAGRTWSAPVSGLFVELTLPVIRLDLDGHAPILDRKRDYRHGEFALDPNGTDFDAVDRPVEVRGRGNTSWLYVAEKKSYQLKFDSDQELLGMAPSRKWVLRSNYFDRSQLRNWVATRIAEVTDLAWTPQAEWVEVVFNGEYAGIYELSEKIEVSKNQLDIDPLTDSVTDDEELTGGYLLQLDRNRTKNDTHDGWTTPDSDFPIYLHRPKPKDSNPEQLEYVKEHVERLESALDGPDFADPTIGYRQFLDTRSFIDYWIVEELTLDTDAYYWSTYFYKTRSDPKLYFGPIWDYDRALGSEWSNLEPDPRGWYSIHPEAPPVDDDAARPWVFRTFQDPTFVAEVADRWNELLPELRRITDELLEIAPLLEPAKANDLLRWADAIDARWNHRYGDVSPADEPEFIAQWLTDRIDWMTTELDSLAAGEDFGRAVTKNWEH